MLNTMPAIHSLISLTVTPFCGSGTALGIEEALSKWSPGFLFLLLLLGQLETSRPTMGFSDCGRKIQRDPSFSSPSIPVSPQTFSLASLLRHPPTILDHEGGEHCGQLLPTPALWESAPRTQPPLPRIAPGVVRHS